MSARSGLVILTLLASCAGCGSGSADDELPDQREHKERDRKPNSSDYCLEPKDYEKFRPGRSIGDVLADVQWRGNFEEAVEVAGKKVVGISFGFYGGPFSDDPRATMLWAVFVDNRFQKFVDWPSFEPVRKLGDHRTLAEALDAKESSPLALERQAAGPPVPAQIDPGVTIAWLVLRGPILARHERELARNAKLRDQLNAARLKLGMSEREVESVLKAKPLASGKFDAGSFRIYGSSEDLDVSNYVHYSNVVVLFKDGTATSIYSGSAAPGGKERLKQMWREFSDLPEGVASPSRVWQPE